mmetsp:Transcript_10189/g.41477  ORF Transcript_10189/g.41477 Transcript_10189/m.41477 type:complete len:507 (-) Transcript_10189:1474-2994(-)
MLGKELRDEAASGVAYEHHLLAGACPWRAADCDRRLGACQEGDRVVVACRLTMCPGGVGGVGAVVTAAHEGARCAKALRLRLLWRIAERQIARARRLEVVPDVLHVSLRNVQIVRAHFARRHHRRVPLHPPVHCQGARVRRTDDEERGHAEPAVLHQHALRTVVHPPLRHDRRHLHEAGVLLGDLLGDGVGAGEVEGVPVLAGMAPAHSAALLWVAHDGEPSVCQQDALWLQLAEGIEGRGETDERLHLCEARRVAYRSNDDVVLNHHEEGQHVEAVARGEELHCRRLPHLSFIHSFFLTTRELSLSLSLSYFVIEYVGLEVGAGDGVDGVVLVTAHLDGHLGKRCARGSAQLAAEDLLLHSLVTVEQELQRDALLDELGHLLLEEIQLICVGSLGCLVLRIPLSLTRFCHGGLFLSCRLTLAVEFGLSNSRASTRAQDSLCGYFSTLPLLFLLSLALRRHHLLLFSLALSFNLSLLGSPRRGSERPHGRLCLGELLLNGEVRHCV